ncbi:MAG: hypothetical protein AAF593_12575, partial [Planctomycetota bacterium]
QRPDGFAYPRGRRGAGLRGRLDPGDGRLFPSADDAGTLASLYTNEWARVRLPIADNAEEEDRHNNSINVSFGDGHGSTVSVEDFIDVNISPNIK